MALSIEEAREVIQKKKHRQQINRAIWQQNRIKFFAETHITSDLTQPLADFMNHVKKILPKDKYNMFVELFRYPLKTNEITGICFDKLSRIFEGRNPAFNYQFVNSDLRDDWEWYRQNKMGEPDIWSTMAWEWFKTDINAVMVIDLPSDPDPSDRYPQPYFYFLRIEDVIEYEADPKSGEMEYLIFKQPEDRTAVIDDQSFRIFKKDDQSLIGSLELENPHDLGYCPARFFWSQSVSLKDPDVKESPLSKELESLEKYLFKYVSKHHFDLYGSYPIYWGYEPECHYSDDKGNYCDHGYLKNEDGINLMDAAGLPRKCPQCGDHRIVGAGSFIEIPVPHGDPKDSDSQADLRDPIGIKTVDREALDWNTEEIRRVKDEIINAVVGVDSNILNEKQVNEDQVKAQFESRSTILQRVKRGFEKAQKFVDDTCCRLRYGKDNFLQSSINYGTEFILQSVEELTDQYQKRKNAGASQGELIALKKKIIEAEHKNNPLELQRALILNDLEPYCLLSANEVKELFSDGVVDWVTLVIKLNFANFIDRFERENMNVIEFADAIDYAKKIEIIFEQLKLYANEQERNRESDPGNVPGKGGEE